ncbi:MAG: hypothetical protein GY861_00985 [bacterium]|nr:hypothetical protein [bacterium]
MAGVKETKDVLLVAVKLAKAFALAQADGKIGWQDLTLLIDPGLAMPEAVAGIGQVPAELGDLDAAEVQEINDYLKANLGAAFSEEVTLYALAAGLNLVKLVDLIKDKVTQPTP